MFMSKTETGASVLELPSWKDDPKVAAIRAKIAELKAEKVRLEEQYGIRPAEAFRNTVKDYQDLLNHGENVRAKLTQSDREQLSLKIPAITKALEQLELDLNGAVIRACAPIWNAAAAEYIGYAKSIADAAAQLHDALLAEQGFLTQVRRQAGSGGNRPIIECLTGILFQSEKAAEIATKRVAEAEKIASKSK